MRDSLRGNTVDQLSALHKKRILVVDDDQATRQGMACLLEAEGYDVAEAANGSEALSRLRGEPLPTLIVLDLMMPGMDGFQFRSEQERDPALGRIPVVIVS